MTGRKGYNSPSGSPVPEAARRSPNSHSRSPSSPSGNTSPLRSTSQPRHASRNGGLGGRKGYNASTVDAHLSPTEAASANAHRAISRGRSGSPNQEAERSSSRHGGLTSGRKGYNDTASSPSPKAHSRSSSASGSPARFGQDPAVNYGPRTHIGMGGRKGYNAVNVAAARDTESAVGLGISEPYREGSPRRHEGLTGRKGYNSTPPPRH